MDSTGKVSATEFRKNLFRLVPERMEAVAYTSNIQPWLSSTVPY